MEKTILAKLKTAYSPLGLGDSVLSALAASLASTGLVTEDNVEAVIAAQKSGLEAVQKSSDKRVSDALAKAKEESDKKNDSAQKELEQMRKQVEELTKKVKDTPKKDPEPSAPPAPSTPPAPESHEWFKAERDALVAEFEKRLAAASEGSKSLSEAVAALKAENEAMKAAAAQKARTEFINSKAKELGIPEWRVSEGFNLAGDATDEAVTEHLTKVAENIRGNMLPSGGLRTAMGAGGKPDKTMVDDIARRLVQRN